MALPLVPLWAAVAAVAGTNLGTGIASYFRGRKNGHRQIIRATSALRGHPNLLTADVDVLVNQIFSQAAALAEQEQTAKNISGLQKEAEKLLEAQKQIILEEEKKRKAVPLLTLEEAAAKADAKAEAEKKADAKAEAEKKADAKAKKAKKKKAA